MLYTLRFFSSKCSLFHNANLFDSYIIRILYTGCAKIKKIFRRQRVTMTCLYADRKKGGTKLALVRNFALIIFIIIIIIIIIIGDRGSTVVKVLCYKSEGRWFDPS